MVMGTNKYIVVEPATVMMHGSVTTTNTVNKVLSHVQAK